MVSPLLNLYHLTLFNDNELALILGTGDTRDYSINPKALMAEVASGAILGGLGAAATTAGAGWPVGALGGALGGGIYYSVTTLINPPTQPSQAVPPGRSHGSGGHAYPWRPRTMNACH